MKKSLIIIVISFCYHLVFAQKIYENYIDGQIYVKFSNRLLKGFNKDNPENLNLSKFGILSKILSNIEKVRSIPIDKRTFDFE